VLEGLVEEEVVEVVVGPVEGLAVVAALPRDAVTRGRRVVANGLSETGYPGRVMVRRCRA
jgi:hypothetical protein